MENLYGQIKVCMKENSKIIILKALGIISGLMADNIREHGETIKCMEEVYSYGLMEENMKESL